jgi:Amidohydrolase
MMDAYTHLDMSAPDPIADFQSRMAAAGVTRAIVLETWSGENLTCLERLIDSSKFQFRLALCFRPAKKLQFKSLLTHPCVIGLRVKSGDLRTLDEVANILESSGRWLIPHAEHGIGSLTNALVSLMLAHPRLPVYVPHLGWPRQNGVDDQDWQPSINQLSSFTGITIGVSAIPHFSLVPYPHIDVQPFVSKVTDAFCADSIVMGSDYPLFEKDFYARYMALARKWIGGHSANHPSNLEAACFPAH